MLLLLMLASQIGGVYTFRVGIAHVADPSIANFADATLQVVSAGMQAVIYGGDRSLDSHAVLRLDASGSEDLDEVPTAVDPTPIRFQWTCVSLTHGDGGDGDACTTQDGAPLALPNTAVLTIAADTLFPGKYLLTVMASRGKVGGRVPFHYRNDSDAVVVSLTDEVLPTLRVDTSFVAASVGEYVTLTTAPILNGHALASLQWTFPDMTSAEVDAVVLSVSLSSPVLSIRANLVAGSYSFVLTLVTVDGLNATASVTVAVNAPPRLGYVLPSPSSGISLETAFQLSTGGWVSDPEVRRRVGGNNGACQMTRGLVQS